MKPLLTAILIAICFSVNAQNIGDSISVFYNKFDSIEMFKPYLYHHEIVVNQDSVVMVFCVLNKTQMIFGIDYIYLKEAYCDRELEKLLKGAIKFGYNIWLLPSGLIMILHNTDFIMLRDFRLLEGNIIFLEDLSTY